MATVSLNAAVPDERDSLTCRKVRYPSNAEGFKVQRVGGRGVEELWVPAEELNEFDRHIVGRIEVVAEHR